MVTVAFAVGNIVLLLIGLYVSRNDYLDKPVCRTHVN